ncbi:MAG TPA: hypothetical protein VE954_04880 [Oligoflexus sp.]|uniref:hypothetical protein n=1 Tax=Oligoflexus sp. TaxID=1971216 RepID=UPI002D2F32C1|nr:hypothetical protein [Oligoflexus sp.]HYX32426.1 hypothetical protein [Oligoflexus sp.]
MKNFVLTLTLLTSSSAVMAQSTYPTRFSDYPVLTQDERETYDVETLMGKTQLELDQIYSQLTAGPTPNGAYDGFVKFDESGDNDIERILAIAVPPHLEGWLKSVGTNLWRGKTFNRERGTLTNRMGVIQRFPARVYCGQSLIDSRRESIVLDYAYGDTIPGYIPAFDWPMTRFGLSIRDEIRMVKPGLYLGRAYIQGIYTLNFILHSQTEADKADWTEVCRS